MTDEAGSFFAGMFLGAAMALIVVTTVANQDKWACEEALPRNVECVWAAPEGRGDE